MADSISQTEQMRSASLNAARYRKQNIQQEVRKGLFQSNASQENVEAAPEESQYKQRLAILKAGAIKNANSELGGATGATVGSALGSALPIVGTSIGFFLGRFIGKKLGIAAIIITLIIGLLLFAAIFIVIIKGTCDYYSDAAKWAAGIQELCSSVGS